MKLFQKFRKKKSDKEREDSMEQFATNKAGLVGPFDEKGFKGNGGGP
jgi:hypothetical protein